MQADADRQKQIQADIDIYTDTYKIIQICTGLWIRCSDYTVVSQETASRKVSVTWCNLLCKWHSSKGNQGLQVHEIETSAILPKSGAVTLRS